MSLINSADLCPVTETWTRNPCMQSRALSERNMRTALSTLLSTAPDRFRFLQESEARVPGSGARTLNDLGSQEELFFQI